MIVPAAPAVVPAPGAATVVLTQMPKGLAEGPASPPRLPHQLRTATAAGEPFVHTKGAPTVSVTLGTGVSRHFELPSIGVIHYWTGKENDTITTQRLEELRLKDTTIVTFYITILTTSSTTIS